MIGDGVFFPQLKVCETILDDLGLLEERNLSPNKSLGAAHFKGMSYRDIYTTCIKELAYDFKLTDQSLMLFVRDGSDIHDGLLGFSYYECPINIMTYKEFVGSVDDLKPIDPNFEQRVAEVGDDWRSDYEQYINTSDSLSIVTPMRYDYKSTDYRAGVHPASHIHFGFANEIRVGTQKIMNPISFTLFILRQRYPSEWERFLETERANSNCRQIREHLEPIHKNYWSARDKIEASIL